MGPKGYIDVLSRNCMGQYSVDMEQISGTEARIHKFNLFLKVCVCFMLNYLLHVHLIILEAVSVQLKSVNYSAITS